MKTIQMGPLNTFKQRAAHIALGLGLAATLALGAVMPTLADEGVEGSLAITGMPIAFDIEDSLLMSAITMDGTDQTATGDLAVKVTDYSGNGTGWAIQVSSSGFTADDPNSTDPLDVLELAGFAVTSTGYTNSSVDSSTAPNNTASQAFTVTDTPTDFANAAAGTGMGEFDFDLNFSLPVPANTLGASYTATVEIDTVVTP